MDKKYMLVCCCARDFDVPLFFNTIEEAQEEMRSQLEEAVGMNVESMEENEYEWGLSETCAYCETMNHDDCDWQIFNLEEVMH